MPPVDIFVSSTRQAPGDSPRARAVRILPSHRVTCRPTIARFFSQSWPITARLACARRARAVRALTNSSGLEPARWVERLAPAPRENPPLRKSAFQWKSTATSTAHRSVTVTAPGGAQMLDAPGGIGAPWRLRGHQACRRCDNRPRLSILIRLASRGGPGTARGVQCSRLTLRIPTIFIKS